MCRGRQHRVSIAHARNLCARKVTFLVITVVVGKSDILASFRRHIITSVFYEEAGVLVKNNVGNTQLKLEAWL